MINEASDVVQDITKVDEETIQAAIGEGEEEEEQEEEGNEDEEEV